MRVTKHRAVAAVVGVATMLSSILLVGTAAQAGTTAHGKSSTTITVAGIGVEWPTLDPATDTQATSDTYIMNSIYGELFEQGPKGAIVPDLATGYAFSNRNHTVTITLRKGVKFQDGTPFNASAVVSSIERDLNPANPCLCQSDFKDVTSVTQDGAYAFQLHLTTPFEPIIDAFFATALNWTVSPSALSSMGEVAFGQNPVGAGPFEVVSNSASATLVTKRNPHYWQAGHPIVAGVTFVAPSSDVSAYDALESGTVQLIEGQFDPSVLSQARAAHVLVNAPGSSPIFVALNTNVAPFNNILAREAIYYATDSKLLLKSVGQGLGTVSESPSGPGSVFSEPTVPGYRTYNLAKAQALVKQVGGITVNLLVPSTPSPLFAEALDSEWSEAGIHVTISLITIQQLVADYASHSWTIITQDMGGVEPTLGVNGLLDRITTYGQFSGIANPQLDGLVNKAEQLVNSTARDNIFKQIYKILSDEAYAPFVLAQPLSIIVSKSLKNVKAVSGAGGLSVNLEDVS